MAFSSGVRTREVRIASGRGSLAPQLARVGDDRLDDCSLLWLSLVVVDRRWLSSLLDVVIVCECLRSLSCCRSRLLSISCC